MMFIVFYFDLLCSLPKVGCCSRNLRSAKTTYKGSGLMSVHMRRSTGSKNLRTVEVLCHNMQEGLGLQNIAVRKIFLYTATNVSYMLQERNSQLMPVQEYMRKTLFTTAFTALKWFRCHDNSFQMAELSLPYWEMTVDILHKSIVTKSPANPLSVDYFNRHLIEKTAICHLGENQQIAIK